MGRLRRSGDFSYPHATKPYWVMVAVPRRNSDGFHPLDTPTAEKASGILGSTSELTMKPLPTALHVENFSNTALKTANTIKAVVHSTTSGSGLSGLIAVMLGDAAKQFPLSY